MDNEVVAVDGESILQETEEVNAVMTEEESVEDVVDDPLVILDDDVEMSGNENEESIDEVDKTAQCASQLI